MSPAIRLAAGADAPALARIHGQCFDEPWDAASFRRLMQGSAFALVAHNAAETELQALILIQAVADEAEILSLATLPHARRRGYARTLILGAADEAYRRGAKTLFLDVAEDNDAALALYRGLGFMLKGRRKGYYQRKGAPAAAALLLAATLPLQNHGNGARSPLD